MPKTESEKFIDKLKSYVVTPNYSSSVKIPDSSEEEDVGQPKYKMPVASPFNSDSENGQLFDTHAQIVKMENQLIDKSYKTAHSHEDSNSILLKDLGVSPSKDIGFIQWRDDIDLNEAPNV